VVIHSNYITCINNTVDKIGCSSLELPSGCYEMVLGTVSQCMWMRHVTHHQIGHVTLKSLPRLMGTRMKSCVKIVSLGYIKSTGGGSEIL
jgi:hypothetical protein